MLHDTSNSCCLTVKKIKPYLPSSFALEQGNVLVAPSEKHIPFEQ